MRAANIAQFANVAARAAVAAAWAPVDLFTASEAGDWWRIHPDDCRQGDTEGSTAAAVDSPVGWVMGKVNGNHLTQATASKRPLLRQDGNGDYYLQGDAVDDRLTAAFAITQPWCRISAIHQVSWTTGDRIFNAATVVSGILFQTGSTPNLGIYSGATLSGIATLALGANGVITERHNGASSRIAHNNNAYVNGNAGTTASDGLILLNREAAAADTAFDGRVYGVVMIGRDLTDDEITSAREYMASVSGVTL